MAKKQLIMEKAIELFAENGIETTSIQQITEKCGISKGAFYLSFKSKDELVLGLIEHFMSEFISEVDQVVKTKETDVLYHFYLTIFGYLQKHSHYARLFMKEQPTFFNVEFFEQINKYDNFLNNVILSLVRRQFQFTDQNMRSDLIFTIKGFMNHYAQLFFTTNYSLDLDLLSKSLVEKTTILAERATIPFISAEYLSFSFTDCLAPSEDELMALLGQKSEEASDPIIRQTLELLMDNIHNPQLPAAIIQGLIKNLQADPHTKWLAYIYGLFSEKQSYR
ncbi:MAG: TetR/AcrR family transcriptional regulator [Bacillus sp. (in: firmicutes)]